MRAGTARDSSPAMLHCPFNQSINPPQTVKRGLGRAYCSNRMKLRWLMLIVSAVVATARAYAGIEYILAHEQPETWPMPSFLINSPAEDGVSPFAKQRVRFFFDPSKIGGPKFGQITSVELVLFRPVDEKERKKSEILSPPGFPKPEPKFSAPDKHRIWIGGVESRESLEMMPREISRDSSYDEFLRLAVQVRFELNEEKHPTQKRIVYLISEFDIRANNGPVETAATPLTK